MRRTHTYALAALCGLAIPSVAQADPGELTPIAVNTQGNNYGYFEYLPRDYDESSDWPVLVFLSGIGEFGTGELPPEGGCPNGPNYDEPVLCRNLRHGPQALIWRQQNLGEVGLWDDVARPFIVIAPQNEAPLFVRRLYDEQRLDAFMDYVVDTYAVDERRIYLFGMSMGGISATDMALYSPERFAAVVPLPGAPGFPLRDVCSITRNAFWGFHGEFDNAEDFGVADMVDLVDAFNACPQPHPVARMTVYDNAGHDVWTRTVDPPIGMNDQLLTTYNGVQLDPYDTDIYEWILQHDRPDVDAGEDRDVPMGPVALAATTIDDDPVSYVWTQLAGPTATMIGADTSVATVTDLVEGTYVFQVRAIDADGMWDLDTVDVIVGDGIGGDDGSADDGSVDDGGDEGSTGGFGSSGGDESGYGDSGGDESEGDGSSGDDAGGDESGGVVDVDCVSSYEGIGSLEDLSDEFDEPGSLACWTMLDPFDDNGIAPTDFSVDVDATTPGALTLEPFITNGWFEAFRGPFLYKEVTGDFMFEISVMASAIGDTSQWPGQDFNSAGMLVRDDELGLENWILWNIGRQVSRPATEGKITTDTASILTLTRVPGPPQFVRLRMCRVGSEFLLTRQLPGDAGFTEVHRYDQPVIDAKAQVGLALSAWSGLQDFPEPGGVPDVTGRWEYARFSALRDVNACLVDVPTCTDGVLNQDETEIDCGGVCGECVVEVCGNGVFDPGEACDDGNLEAGDGCDATCQVEEVDAGPFFAVFTVNNDWGSGYCGVLEIVNDSDQSTTSWQVVLDAQGSVVNNLWNAERVDDGDEISLTPLSWNAVIPSGQVNTSIGLCAVRPAGAGTAQVASATAAF